MFGGVLYRPVNAAPRREELPAALRDVAVRKAIEGRGTVASPTVLGWIVMLRRGSRERISLCPQDERWLLANGFVASAKGMTWTRSDRCQQ